MVDSFDDFSEFNSSITGLVSDQTGSEPLPQKAPSPTLSDAPVIPPPAPPTIKRSESKEQKLYKVKPPYAPLEKSHVSRLKNKKLSLSSNDSYYDQPYSSVDELGTGFSSFTPPPPEDFRNNESSSPTSTSEDTPRDPPKEFSNKLYSLPESQPQFLPSEYAEPEVGNKPKPVEEEVIEPEVTTPPPQAFMSDFEGILNDGYDTDEELNNYLEQQENNPPPPSQSNQYTSSPLPTSSRSQSASPPNRDDGIPVYAVVDKSKKKKKKKEEKEHDAVVVYDERTNL